MKIENQEAGISLELTDDIRQRHVEAYFRAARQMLGGENVSGSEYAGITVRAACEAGLLSGLTEDEVDDLRPGVTTYIAMQINDVVAASMAIPGE